MRFYPVSFTGLATILYLSPICAGWYIYAENNRDLTDDTTVGDNYYKFYNGPPSCNDIEPITFLDAEDVNEVPANSARCDGCSSPLGETRGQPIDQFEWYDKRGDWGHHTWYRDRGGIFVDVNDVRKGTCVQDDSDDYLCSFSAVIFSRRGISQLVCNWDVVTTPPPTPPPTPPQPPPITAKMMVVGDSISHGAEGDWTWRWRLADWLSSQGHKITWVGPYSDGVPGSFAATGHASYWGRQAVQTRETIKDWVSTYQPDYILILLGFNDLGWLFTSPGGLVGVMGDLVGNARQGNPNVKILFGNVVQRSFIGGRQDLVDNTLEYNKLLKTELSQWFRYESPITYVDVATIYRCFPSICPDGYDGLHPDAHGEFSIAIAFANALKVDWHFPGDAMQFGTIPDRPISTPNNVVAAAVPEGIYLAWELVENARGYEFRARIKGLDIWWSDGGSSTFVVWYTWVYPDQEWEFQVRTKVTDSIFSAWSGLVSTVAHPSTAPGPSNIHVTPVGGDSFAISWDAVSGYSINRYEVIVWDQDIPGAWTGGYAAAGTRTTIGGLLNGHRYAIWVATWVNLDGGPAGGVPAGARQVTIGAGTPAAPSGFSASNVDPITAHLTWSSSSGATGYAIYDRALPSGKFTLSGTTTLTSQDVGWLYPGTWNYEFCIAAYNGNLESDHLSCATPPVAPGWSKRTRGELPADASNITFISNTTAPVNGTNMADHVQLQSLWSAMQATRAAADAGLGSNSSISTR